MNKAKNSILIAFLLLPTVALYSYPADNGPFEKKELPTTFPIFECNVLPPLDPNIRISTGITNFGKPQKRSMPIIRILQPPKVETGTSIEIVDPSGKTILRPRHVSEFCSYVDVYWSDLNKDGKPDFIILSWSPGCGLPADDITFALSNKNGYAITTIPTFSPDANDFVDIKHNGTCQFIQTTLINCPKARDGKEHNFWVYNLFEIKGSKIILNNSMDRRFPKWVWYSFKPNHRETDLISSAQKQYMWNKDQIDYKKEMAANHK
jgi:hypothetical protein